MNDRYAAVDMAVNTDVVRKPETTMADQIGSLCSTLRECECLMDRLVEQIYGGGTQSDREEKNTVDCMNSAVKSAMFSADKLLRQLTVFIGRMGV